jgi:hypothetical protein
VPELAAKLALASGLERAAIGGNMSAPSPKHAEIADDAIYIEGSKKHPIEDAGSHQRRKVGGNRRSRFLPKWRDMRDSDENYVYSIALYTPPK